MKEHVLEAIASGELGPGRRIVELEFAQKLGVSQTAVREALGYLEMMGIVESGYYRGAHVRQIPKEDANEIWTLLNELEHRAVVRALPFLQENAAELRTVAEELKAAILQRDRLAFGRCDRRFRTIIVESSGSKFLTQTWTTLMWQTALMDLDEKRQQRLQKTHKNYLSIIESLEDGDADRASACLAQFGEYRDGVTES